MHVAEIAAYHGTLEVQKLMHQNPGNEIYADAELLGVKEYIQKHQTYVEFLKQKAKVGWLKHDENTTFFFYQSIRARRLKNHVYSICDEHGNWVDRPKEVAYAFLNYYTKLLGTTEPRKAILTHVIECGPMVIDAHILILEATYTIEEVRHALMSLPDSKSPGPYGFGA